MSATVNRGSHAMGAPGCARPGCLICEPNFLSERRRWSRLTQRRLPNIPRIILRARMCSSVYFRGYAYGNSFTLTSHSGTRAQPAPRPPPTPLPTHDPPCASTHPIHTENRCAALCSLLGLLPEVGAGPPRPAPRAASCRAALAPLPRPAGRAAAVGASEPECTRSARARARTRPQRPS